MEEEQVEAIARKIKTALREAEMTQEALGNKLGISQAQVNYWVTGNRTPTVDNLQKIADALGKPLGYFTSEIKKPTLEFVEQIAYDTTMIPIKGTSSASKTKFIVEETEAYLPLKKTTQKQFAIRVEGDCMVDPDDPANSIYQGNYVIVDPEVPAEEEDVVLARISDEYSTIKRLFYKDEDTVELVPDNPKYKPIVKKLCDIEIIGKVVHIHRPSRKKRRRTIA